MSTRTKFTDQEIAYLQSQYLSRVGTVDPDGRPRVVPTGFAIDTENHAVHLGGRDFANTKRVEDVQLNPHITLVVDDVVDPQTWSARAVIVRGLASMHTQDESNSLPPFLADSAWMAITPTSIRSWGINEEDQS